MISELVDPALLTKVMKQFGSRLEHELRRLEAGDASAHAEAESAGASKDDVREASEGVKTWQRGEAKAPSSPEAPIALPRSPVASLVQSAYEEFFSEGGRVVSSKEQRLSGANVPATDQSLDSDAREFLLGQREYLGGRWATKYAERDARFLIYGAAAKVSTWMRGGKHAFLDSLPTPITMPNRVRVLIVGDWGSGIERAKLVGAVMGASVEEARAAAVACHVVHLGDVYYTGQAREYDQNFLAHWPVQKTQAGTIGSWCLNANHDMYSGGFAYFDHLLKDARFARQEQRSFFGLENDYWQILGLDSAYDDGDLYGPQAAWVAQQRGRARQKKGMLLSHHQPFSAWEPTTNASPLLARLAPVLQDGLVRAWFWGHEHRCAAYAAQRNIQYPRLVGHGGVPVWASRIPKPASVDYESSDDWFPAYIDEKFARFGYVRLDFDGPQIKVNYINELGQSRHDETIQ